MAECGKKNNKGKINGKRHVSSMFIGENVEKEDNTGVNICDKQNINDFNQLTDLDMEVNMYIKEGLE